MNTKDRELINSTSRVFQIIGSKWKPEILYTLVFDGKQRFSELQRQLPDITQRMLTQRLRELERDGLISRTIYAEVPIRVEYEMTELGLTVDPVFRSLSSWATTNEKAVKRANSAYEREQ